MNELKTPEAISCLFEAEIVALLVVEKGTSLGLGLTDRTSSISRKHNTQKMNLRSSDQPSEVDSFSAAFHSLAHHLFPDGCPEESLVAAWPQRSNRVPVSARQALGSLHQLREVAKLEGLTTDQMSCVALVASTIEKRRMEEIIMCIQPRHDHTVDSSLVINLMTLPCNDVGRLHVLRLLTLAIRRGALVGEARTTLLSFYPKVFACLPKQGLCADAMRLLHAITRKRHARVDRAQRLHRWYQDSITLEQPVLTGSLWIMLQLYARYNPQGCGKYFPATKRLGTSLFKLFQSMCACNEAYLDRILTVVRASSRQSVGRRVFRSVSRCKRRSGES